MDSQRLDSIAAVISYMEAHLWEKAGLDAAAHAVRYSKYHLHRMFTDTVGVTPHSYIRRRRLTEAARLLVFSDRPILEIALTAGYESQQAFTTVFRSMYKQTPLAYRQSRAFYPLQLRFTPLAVPSAAGGPRVLYAQPSDIDGWMQLLPLVVGGFPHLEMAAHLEQVQQYVRDGRALILRDGTAIVGGAACSPRAGSIDFLAVHPQYRRRGAAQTLLTAVIRDQFRGRAAAITTFRAGDRADNGQRAEYKRLGFVESELVTEFGYPAQRLILPPGQEIRSHG